MINKNECPECGSIDTERQWLDTQMVHIEEIRTCDCGTEYVNRYELVGKEEIQ